MRFHKVREKARLRFSEHEKLRRTQLAKAIIKCCSQKRGTLHSHYLLDTNNWIAHVIAETDASGQLTAHYSRGDDMLKAY